MHQKSILTLEYPKILERVAKEAAFSASKVLVMEREPTPDISAARRRLAYTTEAHQLLELYNNASVQGARDIRPLLARAAREGMLLPSLGAYIPQRPHIARRIEETISEEGEVLDTASSTLRKLRFDIRGANQRLQDRLRRLVSEFGHALQEPIVTMRNDRYVIPV